MRTMGRRAGHDGYNAVFRPNFTYLCRPHVHGPPHFVDKLVDIEASSLYITFKIAQMLDSFPQEAFRE